MISSPEEYAKAREEIRILKERLRSLQDTSARSKEFTAAGIRKLIARLHQELALCEGNGKSQ